MSQALFDELEVTGDVLLVRSGHQQLGAHCWAWERVGDELSMPSATLQRSSTKEGTGNSLDEHHLCAKQGT